MASYIQEAQDFLNGKLQIADKIAKHKKEKKRRIYVKTGDRTNASTEACVYIILYDDAGNKSADHKLSLGVNQLTKLTVSFRQGALEAYPCPDLPSFGKISKIELYQYLPIVPGAVLPTWFCEFVVVYDGKRDETSYFPVQRWFRKDEHRTIHEYHTSLPQCDPEAEQRRADLERKRQKYQLNEKDLQLPAQVKNLPLDEGFSKKYENFFAFNALEKLGKTAIAFFATSKWDSLDDVGKVYGCTKYGTPKSYTMNKGLSDDVYFGAQRLTGVNPHHIQLCKQLPDNFPVTDEMVNQYLEGMTLVAALKQNKFFLVDHLILNTVPTKDCNVVCCPMALFFLNAKQLLMPIAIQLFRKPSRDNPIFTPGVSHNTWLMAKMWFNAADASIHQSVAHLGSTHMMMEGFAVCMHRHLASNHPIFRLLSPHFLYLMEINGLALTQLVNPGGWVDKAMAVGRVGMRELMRRQFDEWRLDTDSNLKKDLILRGVADPGVLPCYPYRDDGILLYDAIEHYVTKVVSFYYDTPEKISNDIELQNWAKELTTPRDKGGAGYKGIPGDGCFTSADQIALAATCIIFTCSVQHAAVNFGQYDEYGYPPNYPGYLQGKPPHDETPITGGEILKAIPPKRRTLDIMAVTRILSEMGTQPLGDFELQYQYHPQVLKYEIEFREELKRAGEMIDQRNKERDEHYVYPYIRPDHIPNAISI